MTFGKKRTILLILAFSLSAIAGGFHHCCDFYSHACSICIHGATQPDLFPAPAIAADGIRPSAVASRFVLPAENIPNPSMVRAPLSGRAPPIFS